jgi:acetoacetate decarboxylase
MGFPKRLGQIYLTEYTGVNPAMEVIGIGSRLKGQVSAHGERLLEGTAHIRREVGLEDLPELMQRPVFHVRYFPSVVEGAPPSVLELVRLKSENVQYGERFWLGDGSLNFYPSDVETYSSLEPKRVEGAYHFHSGYTFSGGEVLYKWTS